MGRTRVATKMAAPIRVLNPRSTILLKNARPVAAVNSRNKSIDVPGKPITDDLNSGSISKGTGGRSSFNGKIVTVFGATGFAGRSVANQLGKSGTQLIFPYRGEHQYVRDLKLVGDLGQVLYHPFYLRDEESIRKCMKYSNAVINLIGSEWETRNFKFDDVHETGARTIARIAKEEGVKTLIHVSSLNASEKPQECMLKGGSQFLTSKWKGENAVKEEFPDAIIIRPSDIYGQEDRHLNYYANRWRKKHVFYAPPPVHLLLQFKGIPLWKRGEHTIKQPLWVGDFARGVAKVLFDKDAAGKTYEFVGPKRYYLSEMVDYYMRCMYQDKLLDGPSWYEQRDGYKRCDVKWSPLWKLKMSISEYVEPICDMRIPMGWIGWDKFEREHVTDVLTGAPTLEDLGVSTAVLEDRCVWELKKWVNYQHFEEDYGLYNPPAPPKSADDLRLA